MAARPKHFRNDALAAILGRGETQDFDHDLVFGLCALGAGIANVNAVAEDRAIDADVALFIPFEIDADELAARPLYNFKNDADRL